MKNVFTVHLTFATNLLIEFSPYGARSFLWLDLYHMEYSLTEQLFEHLSLLLNDLFLQ